MKAYRVVAYRIIAYLIAVDVIVQAAALALASFGFSHWIDEGAVADKATFEGEDLHFTGAVGYSVHGVNGALFIPILALALLILSFFVRSAPGAITWAAIVTGLVALQVFLGFASHSLVGLGAIHGINAFALFVCALHAARRLPARVNGPQPEPAGVSHGVL